jgi:hypothetical protein
LEQEGLRERMELLEIGEKLGWPRLGYGRSTKIPHDKRIPQGKAGWEKFCAHAHVRRIYPALRIGRVLRDNNVEVFHPLSGKEVAVTVEVRNVGVDAGYAMDPSIKDSVFNRPFGLLDEIVQTPEIVPVDPAPRRKRGGHKRPPHPNSKRNRSTAS